MRRRVGVLLLAVVCFSGPLPAAADELVVRGSWTQLRPVGMAPDVQQSDGDALPVLNSPLGVLAYSALQVGSAASLTLQLRSSTGVPQVWACPATAAWVAGDRQSWDTRPAFACEQHAEGVLTGDRMTWQLPAATGLGVVLVPDPSSTSAFAASFGAPTSTSLPPATSPQVPAPVVPTAAGVVVPAPGPVAAVGPLTAPAAVDPVQPQVQLAAPQVPQLASARPVATSLPHASPSTDHRGVGAALVAFLALLLMIRTALPVRPLAPPTSLLHRPKEIA